MENERSHSDSNFRGARFKFDLKFIALLRYENPMRNVPLLASLCLVHARCNDVFISVITVVLQSTSQGNTTAKTIRIATQSLVRPHIRNIAPAPLSQQQQQQPRQPKTLVLKTIPLKVKQVAPTTIKMPPRQVNPGLPHNVVHQQPTEVTLFPSRLLRLMRKEKKCVRNARTEYAHFHLYLYLLCFYSTGLPEVEQLPQQYAEQLPVITGYGTVRRCDSGMRGTVLKVSQDDSIFLQRLLGGPVTGESVSTSHYFDEGFEILGGGGTG